MVNQSKKFEILKSFNPEQQNIVLDTKDFLTEKERSKNVFVPLSVLQQFKSDYQELTLDFKNSTYNLEATHCYQPIIFAYESMLECMSCEEAKYLILKYANSNTEYFQEQLDCEILMLEEEDCPSSQIKQMKDELKQYNSFQENPTIEHKLHKNHPLLISYLNDLQIFEFEFVQFCFEENDTVGRIIQSDFECYLQGGNDHPEECESFELAQSAAISAEYIYNLNYQIHEQYVPK